MATTEGRDGPGGGTGLGPDGGPVLDAAAVAVLRATAREWFVHPLEQWRECDADYVDAFVKAFLESVRASGPEESGPSRV